VSKERKREDQRWEFAQVWWNDAFKSPFTGVKDVPVKVTDEGDLEDGRLV